MKLQQVFIANLKKFRKEQGLSQMTLSRMCNTTSNYIGQIEMGRRIPSFDKIEEIAAALEIAPGRLFIEETPEGRERIKPKTKDYLQRMPAHVKKELIARLMTQIKADVTGALDSEEY